VISIGLIREDKSSSSLLSDCTKGLVGAFKTKLDDSEDDKEGARDRAPSLVKFLSADGNRGSNWKGEKPCVGDVASQSGCPDLYNPAFACKRLLLPSVFSRGPSVKSPLCKADRGLSICWPASDRSMSIGENRAGSEISAGGSNGEFEGLGDDFRALWS
jgi:hypothetical protein